jgi:hypothetical protein
VERRKTQVRGNKIHAAKNAYHCPSASPKMLINTAASKIIPKKVMRIGARHPRGWFGGCKRSPSLD